MSILFSCVLFGGGLCLLFLLRFNKIIDVISLNKRVISFEQLIYPRQPFPFGSRIVAFSAYIVDIFHNLATLFDNAFAICQSELGDCIQLLNKVINISVIMEGVNLYLVGLFGLSRNSLTAVEILKISV